MLTHSASPIPGRILIARITSFNKINWRIEEIFHSASLRERATYVDSETFSITILALFLQSRLLFDFELFIGERGELSGDKLIQYPRSLVDTVQLFRMLSESSSC
jgi:hypothetical protein